jgi:uncharacterized membrane protein YbhN (UPF0104 family)
MDRPATVAASLNDSAKIPDTGGRNIRRALFSLAGTLAFIGILVYLLARHGSEISRAADRASSTTLIAVILLAAASLVARGEAAVAALTAMGNRPSRLDIHPASSAAFVVSTLNHYLASPVRAAVLKRLDRGRAPTIPQMFMVDASTYLIEGLLAAVLIVVSASALKLEWWIPVLAVVAALVALGVALVVRQRLQRLTVFRGLEMLAHSRQRLVVLALSVIVFGCQIARTLLVLRATGLHPSLLQAAATFVAGGVLSSFLAGPAAGTAGAPLIIFGHRSLAAAAAAGLILSITALLAALLYAVACGPIVAWRLRHGDPPPGRDSAPRSAAQT